MNRADILNAARQPDLLIEATRQPPIQEQLL